MKKFASILLALVLCVAMAVPAFAADVITYNGGVSSYLVASNASIGTKTFTDFGGKEQTAYVYPAGTLISLNFDFSTTLQFNNIADAEDPFHQLGLNFWDMADFVPEAGIIYTVATFDGATFGGDTCYLTVEAGSAAEPVKPAAAPAVTNKAGTTTVQANSWTEGGLITMVFETLKVEKVSLPGPGSSTEYLVLVLKPGSKLPYIDAMSPMRMVDEGFYVSDGIYPGASGVAEDLFVPTFPGLPACEYVGIWGTEYDLPVLLTLPADEPEAPAATTTPESAPTPEPSVQPEPSPEPEAPAEDEPAPTPSTEPETPVEDQPAPAPSAEPEAPVEDQPAPAPSAEPEAPAADEAPADTAPVAPETPETPAVPVEESSNFPVGIVVAIVAVVVIAAVAVVVLKKKK